jgi:death-on-curing family protein
MMTTIPTDIKKRFNNQAKLYAVALRLGNHAFQNGNKRVALAAGSVFLWMNGYQLTLSQSEAEKLIFDLVTHKVGHEQTAEIIAASIKAL